MSAKEISAGVSPTSPGSAAAVRFGHLRSASLGMCSATKTVREIRDDVSVLMEPYAHSERPIRLMSVVLNLLQTALGVGILSLAATCQYTGVVGGSLLLCGGGFLAYHVVKLMSVSMVLSGTESYEGLGEFCYGATGRVVVQVTLIFASFLALICFLVPLKHSLFDALRHLLSYESMQRFQDIGGSPNLCLAMALVGVILPLCMKRRIDSLWFTSLVGVFFDLYFLVMSFAYFLSNFNTPLEERVCHELNTTDVHTLHHHLARDAAASDAAASTPHSDLLWIGGSFAEFTRTLSIIACSFVCHSSVFPIYRELRTTENVPASFQKITQATKIVMAVASLIYVIVAASGYSMFRELSDKASSILACYDPSDPAVIICYFGMCVVLMCGFPLILYSVRYCAATFFYSDEAMKETPISLWMHVGLTVVLVAPVAVVALFTNRLAIVMTVGGGVCLPFFCFILPAVLYLKVLRLQDGPACLALLETESASAAENSRNIAFMQALSDDPWRYTRGHVMLAIGLVIQILSVYGTVVAATQS